MNNKEKYLFEIYQLQCKICETILTTSSNVVVIGKPFIGKTTIVNLLFNKIDGTVIYHTGCNPIYREQANIDFLNILQNYIGKKNVYILLDEYYDNYILQKILDFGFKQCIIFTNDSSFSYDSFVSIKYIDLYNKFMNLFFKNDNHLKNMNIVEINNYFSNNLSEQKQEKLKKMRQISNQTSIKIKENSHVSEKRFYFDN